LKRRLRWVLMAVCAAGLLHALDRAVAGMLPPWQAASVIALGLGAAWRLPRGGRGSGWLFSLWCAVALICFGISALEGVEDRAERLRVGIMGGGAFLGLSILGLHACTPERKTSPAMIETRDMTNERRTHRKTKP